MAAVVVFCVPADQSPVRARGDREDGEGEGRGQEGGEDGRQRQRELD